MNDTVEERLARVETELQHATTELRRVGERLDKFLDGMVSRREFDDLKQEFVEYKKTVEARRPPLWIILGIVITALLGVFNIVPKG